MRIGFSMDETGYNSMNERFAAILIEKKIIPATEINRILNEDIVDEDQFLGDILLEEDFLKPLQIATILSKALGIPFLKSLEVDVSPKVVGLIPSDVCMKYKLFPIGFKEEDLTVAVYNPLNEEAMETVRDSTSFATNIVIMPLTEIDKALDLYFTPGGEIKTGVTRRITEKKGESKRLSPDTESGPQSPYTSSSVAPSSGSPEEDMQEGSADLTQVSESETKDNNPEMLSKNDFYRVTGNKAVLFQKWESRFTSPNVIKAHKINKEEFELTSGIFKRMKF